MNKNPFVPHTTDELKQLLAVVGVADVNTLFREQVPEDYLLKDTSVFTLPQATDECSLQRDVKALAASNDTSKVSFLGGGIYEHFIPSAVDALALRGEFLTAYTPYQPEISQGILQVYFEFQTMTASLLGLDVANASMYDVASAAAEAVLMAVNATGRDEVVVLGTVNPDVRETVASYCGSGRLNVIEVKPGTDGRVDADTLGAAIGARTACVLVQQPNYFGCLEEVATIAELAHKARALVVAAVDPVSLGVLEAPGAWGADIAVAEGQGLGLPMYGGGETVGLMACKQNLCRKLPGRIIGMTHDVEGKRGYVLTLQTREQHIRREKATSNICTNSALNALRVTVYLSLMGFAGLERVARLCVRNLARLRGQLPAAALRFAAPCFDETVIKTRIPAAQVIERLMGEGFYAGIDLGKKFGADFENSLLVCVTECRSDDEIDRFAAALTPLCEGGNK